MSTKENDLWIEAAWDNFHEALEQKDVELAKAVIADAMDSGFTEEARKMNVELREYHDSTPSFVGGFILAYLRKRKAAYSEKGLVPTLDLLIEDLESQTNESQS